MFSSACKARSVHANIYMDSASGGSTSQVIRSDKRLQVMATALTDSKDFTHFMTGLRSRNGEHRNQDVSTSINLIIEMQKLFELEWQLAVKQNNKELIRTAVDNGLFHISLIVGV